MQLKSPLSGYSSFRVHWTGHAVYYKENSQTYRHPSSPSLFYQACKGSSLSLIKCDGIVREMMDSYGTRNSQLMDRKKQYACELASRRVSNSLLHNEDSWNCEGDDGWWLYVHSIYSQLNEPWNCMEINHSVGLPLPRTSKLHWPSTKFCIGTNFMEPGAADRTTSAPMHFDRFYCRTLPVVDPPPRVHTRVTLGLLFAVAWPLLKCRRCLCLFLQA